MRQLFYYKIRQKLIKKSVRFFIRKCDSYYKIGRLLQIATVHPASINAFKCSFSHSLFYFKLFIFQLTQLQLEFHGLWANQI